MNQNEDYIDLLSLCSVIRDGLEELFPDKIWVKAEVAAVQTRANGHCYLELVQSENGIQKAKARAVIWASRYGVLSKYYRDATDGDITPGQQILVRAQVNYSELYGLSLLIDDISPEFTLGDAELQRKKTIEALMTEGLLRKQGELQLGVLPRSLAVISARDAAGFGDFTHHLLDNEYGFSFKVTLFEATMQGSDCPRSICGALDLIEQAHKGPVPNPETGEEFEGPYDAVLILRGGGSPLDLACFDDYNLCRAIALCPLPVYTAIGHDKDYHVADMVSFKFVKTPTALSDEFLSLFLEADSYITRLSDAIKLALFGKVALLESRLERLNDRIALANPEAVLDRGYALLSDRDGKIIRSRADLAVGKKLRARLSDAQVNVLVEGIEPLKRNSK